MIPAQMGRSVRLVIRDPKENKGNQGSASREMLVLMVCLDSSVTMVKRDGEVCHYFSFVFRLDERGRILATPLYHTAAFITKTCLIWKRKQLSYSLQLDYICFFLDCCLINCVLV